MDEHERSEDAQPSFASQPLDSSRLGSSRFEDRRSSYPYLLPFDTKTLLKKLLGLLYFFLGGIVVFLSFYLPDTLLRDTALRYVVPIVLGVVSIILIINGYFKLTEDDRAYKW